MKGPDGGGAAAEAVRALNDAGWPFVQERVLSGLAHDVNGRTGSLSGLLELLAVDGDDEELVPHLRKQIDWLRVSAEALSRLARRPGTPSVVRLPDVVGGALALHRRHSGLEDGRLEEGGAAGDAAPAVALRADEVLLVRLLLVVLADAAWRRSPGGGGGAGAPPGRKVAVGFRRSEGRVEVRVEGPAGEPDPEGPLAPGCLERLHAAAEALGGELSAEAAGGSRLVRLGLPVLEL